MGRLIIFAFLLLLAFSLYGQESSADPKIPDPDTAFQLSWKTGLGFLEQGSHAKALNIFNELLQYYEARPSGNPGDQEKIARIYNVIGAIYEETGLWNDAMAMYMNSLRICDETGNQAGKARIYNNLGKLYYSRNELNKAEELFHKAIEINSQLNNRSELFNNYNNLAGVFSHRKMPEKALEYALIGLTQLDLEKDFFDLSIAYSNIGNLYQDMSRFQIALSYYQQAAGIQEEKSFQAAHINSLLSISNLFDILGNQDSARFYIQEALDLTDRMNNPSLKLTVYRTAGDYFAKHGNHSKANALFSTVLVLNDSLETLNSLTKLEQIQSVYDIINKEKDNQILQQRVNLQQLALQRQRIILAAAAALVIFFLIFVITQRRNNKRKQENARLILQQAELLHQQEKNILLNKERSLELELDYKNRQLTSYALHLARNNEFAFKVAEELKHMLVGMSQRDKERAEKIRNMISEINQFTSGNSWEEFRLYFEEVHQSFEKNLSTAFPNLSSNDKKICALLKLGLTTKEIASITFRELRSVESSRNRLRKKLNLTADVSIQTFLSQF